MFNEKLTLSGRQVIAEGVFIEWSVSSIRPDRWRPHGVKYRLAYIEHGRCRVLFDNHTGKKDHFHVDKREFEYKFTNLGQLRRDFEAEITKLGVTL